MDPVFEDLLFGWSMGISDLLVRLDLFELISIWLAWSTQDLVLIIDCRHELQVIFIDPLLVDITGRLIGALHGHYRSDEWLLRAYRRRCD